MAKTATRKPPKVRPLAVAALLSWGASLLEGSGVLPLPLDEVGEPVETVPLAGAVVTPVGTTTVELPPVGRGTTAVVPTAEVTTSVVGTADTVSQTVFALSLDVLTTSGSSSGAGTSGLSGSARGTLSRD